MCQIFSHNYISLLTAHTYSMYLGLFDQHSIFQLDHAYCKNRKQLLLKLEIFCITTATKVGTLENYFPYIFIFRCANSGMLQQ